ncbi:Gfo/Idh/MocA family oxidoreductase [Paenibacillus sp. GCM10027626]|uniref:Gfo/Idh/MocA family oxidoreductase n=1 Tax=Paenibacillus sp. GCM10027626 TaxID=3273411 RepID=UPI0036388FEC
MKKVALVGAGGRALHMFARPLATELREDVHFCGVYDHNKVRAALLAEECEVPVYTDFHQMIETAKPDIVLVATTDNTHHIYINTALEAGCDVISEKPLTTDADKCQSILDTETRTGRQVTVTFNLRFTPYFARIKEVLDSGAIGKILHVDMQYFLDRLHGADYFRRWHAEMDNSGGLLVHKSTHHFDIINWWLGADPKSVHGFGTRSFYGPTREQWGERCSTCSYKESCEFYVDYTQDEFTNRYYMQAEQEDGYYRDRCVFHERIDIYDTMSVQVRYDSGAILTYSLVTYSPDEGWKAAITGTDGRMEVACRYSGPERDEESYTIKIVKPSGEILTEIVPIASGGHGGGDEKLRAMLFKGGIADPLGQQAGSKAGAMSLLIGAAANRSIAENKVIQIAELMNFS